MESINSTTGRDPELWEIAKKRVGFKYHLTSYLVMNTFFWAVWYLNGQHYSYRANFPWPVWPMLGWGIGLLFHFMGAYVFPRSNSTEREYQKLKNKQL